MKTETEIVIVAERPDTADAFALVKELDEALGAHYPVESRHGFSVDKLLQQNVAFFVIRVDGRPAGCGGVQILAQDRYAEVKRMYVRPQFRGQQLAYRMLVHLADVARAADVPVLRLETGIYQDAAIRLYERFGFVQIPPFADYFEDPLSLCYEMKL